MVFQVSWWTSRKTAGIAPYTLPIDTSLLGPGCPSVPTTPTQRTVRIRAKIMSAIQRQSALLQEWRDELTFLWQALEGTGLAMAPEPSGYLLSTQTIQNQTKLRQKLTDMEKSIPNLPQVVASWPDSSPIQEFGKHQQRGLCGLAAAGIGLELAGPPLPVPTPFSTHRVALSKCSLSRGHVCHVSFHSW